MSNLEKDLKSLTELKALQGLRRLLAEQASIEAFQHLSDEEERRDQANDQLIRAGKDWDKFWDGQPSDPAWLSVLTQRIKMKKDVLIDREQDVSSAQKALESSLINQTQQRKCEEDLGTRVKRRTRLFLSQRDEKSRESIPRRKVMMP